MEEQYVVLEGRPEEQRAPREERVYDLLDSLHIPYRRVDHEATPSIEACAGINSILGIHICKNLFLCNSQKTQFYLLLMPGDKPFKTKELSKQINSSRLSFAPPEYMEELLDLYPGSVSILGLMNDHKNKVTLLVDRDVYNEEYLGCHPCVNTSSLALKTTDVFDVVLPAIHHPAIFVELS